MKTNKTLAAALVALSLSASPAGAACMPSDLIGTWQVTVQAGNLIWRTPAGVFIDSRGNMREADIKPFDGEIYMWRLASVVPIRVDRSCNVTGQITISYPISEYRAYELRSIMSRSKDDIGDTAVTPGYDNGPAIMIRMIKK